MIEHATTSRADSPPLVSLGAVVGQNVQRRRRELKIRQEDLVERLAAHGMVWQRPRVTELESGRKPGIGLAEVITLAAACETSVLELLQTEANVLLYPVPATVSPDMLYSVLGASESPQNHWQLLLHHEVPGTGRITSLSSRGGGQPKVSREFLRQQLMGRAEVEQMAQPRKTKKAEGGDE